MYYPKNLQFMDIALSFIQLITQKTS